MTKDRLIEIINNKVAGKIEACHDATGHHYRFVESGKVVDSVTTKLILEKKHLTPWSIKMAIEWLEHGDRWNKYLAAKKDETNEYLQGAILAPLGVRDDAGNIGTHVHQAAEDFINQWIKTEIKPDDIISFIPEAGKSDGRVWAGARSVKKLFDDRPHIVPVASELLVGNERLNSAGTLDLIVMNGKDVEIWDFKTSNQIDKIGYSMQVAAYSSMFTSMTRVHPKAWRVVKISKDMDKVELHKLKGYQQAISCFQHLSKVYDLINSGLFTLEKDVPKIIL